jgi:hypothetical protein
MSIRGIILVALVILIIILLINYSSKSSQLSNNQDGTVVKIISASDLNESSTSSTNYAYSVWFYVDDWTYKYGREKVILSRIDKDGKTSPKISLGAFQNNLEVAVNTYPDGSAAKSTGTGAMVAQTYNCNVNNVPIQSWVNAIVSINGRTLDVYLDGKLVKTCVMPGVAKPSTNSPVIITPEGGFSGYTSNIEYFPNPLNPQEAWNVYKKGFGGSILGNLFNKYRLRISFYSDNTEKSSFEI